MEFYRYLIVLRKHLGLVVLLTLLGGGSALATGMAGVFMAENAVAQAAGQNPGPASQLDQSLGYFRHKIGVLQKRYDALLARSSSNEAQVSQAESDLSTLEDTYYKLLGT